MISRILSNLILLGALALPLSCFASKEPIFINLTTNDPDKVLMALDASQQYSKKGYPIIIYLNDKAVVLGMEEKFGNENRGQQELRNAISYGAKVIVCPTCLADLGLDPKNLAQGVTLGPIHTK